MTTSDPTAVTPANLVVIGAATFGTAFSIGLALFKAAQERQRHEDELRKQVYKGVRR